ncbi:RNA-binding transcriptional accessory protein [bacterium]|nr:RNA-binding transcriptional accessory protein [bacterium]
MTLIADTLKLQFKQVKNTAELLDADNTVPFIARYRKELTGSLDEEQIRCIQDQLRYIRNLEERKQTVLKSIEEQGKLTPELQGKILSAQKLQEVEDLYLPYKPKRRTRATVAREKGLELLADLMWLQEIETGSFEEIASRYLNTEKGIDQIEDALSGARDIIAERISEHAEFRQTIRRLSIEAGMIRSEGIDEEAGKTYEIYIDYTESVKKVPPHRILAINRGEKEAMLRVWIEVDQDPIIEYLFDNVITNPASLFTGELKTACEDAYQRLIAPAIQRELRNMLTEKADEHAIRIFAENLRALLLVPPLRNQIIMGIDPGYRTGCKVAVIDETGKYMNGITIYPHPPQKRTDESRSILKDLIIRFGVRIVAIGNGTASRETELLVADLIRETDRELHYTIVNEAGASVYSASPVARQEFPDLEASMRGNISIARRLLDPLSELVKIDPKSIGVGLYQHDVNQTMLSESLDHVVESCVNAVGVDVNTASYSLLRYVAGINSRIAENIVKYREACGKFLTRKDLMSVSGLGQNSYMQSAGFLRIPDGSEFFDSTSVHPESYAAAQKLLEHLEIDITELRSKSQRFQEKLKQSRNSLDALSGICGCGPETLSDIIDCLEKPNRDPRDEMPKPVLRSDVLSMEDLYEGLVLKGTIRNVVDFGAFVDIGVKQDGLIHLSQMAKRYIKHPLEVLKVGDVVDVKILNVDIARGRIGLSMILDS